MVARVLVNHGVININQGGASSVLDGPKKKKGSRAGGWWGNDPGKKAQKQRKTALMIKELESGKSGALATCQLCSKAGHIARKCPERGAWQAEGRDLQTSDSGPRSIRCKYGAGCRYLAVPGGCRFKHGEDASRVPARNRLGPRISQVSIPSTSFYCSFSVQASRPALETKPAIKVVLGPTLLVDGMQPVVLVLVESVSRVWVQRKEDEKKVGQMTADLASMTAGLVPVRRPTTGGVYGSKFSEDNVMYRVVVLSKEADGSVIVRYIDFGNAERKETSELVHLPDQMARFPVAAHRVTLEENKAVKDSQANRDDVEKTLEGDLELVFEQGKCVAVKSEGTTLEFSFNRTSGKAAPEGGRKRRRRGGRNGKERGAPRTREELDLEMANYWASKEPKATS